MALLLNYGLLDFCGALMIKLMRPLFNLPGRSALDCLASWLRDGSIVGFADMFLPSVIASSIESEIPRFVVAATSVTQLIYMSEIESIIMRSKIPISLTNLFIVFIERTIVTLPIENMLKAAD